MAVLSEVALAIPFTITPTGGIEVSDTQQKIWSDRVLSVLGTAIGERIHRHFFGSEVHQSVFHTQDDADRAVRSAVTAAFDSQLPRLTLTKIETSYDSSEGVLNSTVFYRLPNDQEFQTVLGSVTISNNEPVREN
jgi:phage baseplate assembly protein W